MNIRGTTALLFAPVIFLILLQNQAYADVSEYDLKAVYLERFTRFVEWPAGSSIDDPANPFIICVVGKNEFGSRIEQISDTLKIRNKKIAVRYISHLNEIDECHLLFISGKTKQSLSDILAYTKDKPILTVSDTAGYGEQGVYINYFFENKRLRFEINQSAVQESKLKMSHMLLQRARILNPTRDTNENS